MKIKTGIGIDVHRLEAGREFWLGGIKIGHEKGCVAHSDGDVLIHAICDALLGATGLGDIGQHFPDTCPAYYRSLYKPDSISRIPVRLIKGSIVSSCCKKRKP